MCVRVMERTRARPWGLTIYPGQGLTRIYGQAQETRALAPEEAGDPSGPLRSDHGEAPICLLYTSPSPRDLSTSRMPSSA